MRPVADWQQKQRRGRIFVSRRCHSNMANSCRLPATCNLTAFAVDRRSIPETLHSRLSIKAAIEKAARLASIVMIWRKSRVRATGLSRTSICTSRRARLQAENAAIGSVNDGILPSLPAFCVSASRPAAAGPQERRNSSQLWALIRACRASCRSRSGRGAAGACSSGRTRRYRCRRPSGSSRYGVHRAWRPFRRSPGPLPSG